MAKADETAKILADLKKQHGRIIHAATPEGVLLAFRAPTLEEYEDYQEKVRSNAPIGAARRELAHRTRLLPATSDELNAEFQRYVVLPQIITEELYEIGKAGIQFAVKKD